MDEGTIVHVDYDLYYAESGELVETTREETAKEHEVHQEGREYTPMVCVVGSGNLISGFEESLLSAKPNKDVSLEIAPADAYGEKDPDQIETISIDKLVRHVRDPKSLYIGGQSLLKAVKEHSHTLLLEEQESITTTQWLVRL